MTRVQAVAFALFAPLALLAAGCSTKESPPTTAQPVSWTAGTAERANGSPGSVDVATVCGSATDQFLAEALHHPVSDLKVMVEWGDIGGGRQVLVSGKVAKVHQGPGDLPMDHPLGDDLSMDVDLDSGFKPFSMQLGTAPSDTKAGQLHVEISSGFIPHVPSTAAAPAGDNWRQLSDRSLANFQPGFDHPAVGDRVLVAGRFIVDCGHPDYHTELHPISFMAWSHQAGNKTVVRLYGNAYWDTELYNPDLTLAGQVGSATRTGRPDTKPLPRYLVDEVARLLTGQSDRLHAFELVGSQTPPSTSWEACAPTGSKGSKLSVSFDVRARPGVRFSVVPGQAPGCASVRIDVGKGFSAPDINMGTCVMPWDYLSAIAGEALSATVDTRAVIRANLPPSAAHLLDTDPVSACAEPLTGPVVSGSPTGRSLQTDAAQPFPIYGVVTIQRS